jgi:hypothetical protein
MFNFKEYEDFTDTTAVYQCKEVAELSYLTLGIASEAGEVAGKVKRIFRGDYNEQDKQIIEISDIPEDVRLGILKELGDICWYICRTSKLLGASYEYLHSQNKHKLEARLLAHKLMGEGDNR